MSCVQAWTLLAHWSYCLDTPCTLELLLGHSLYTTQVLLGHSLYTRATAWILPQVLLGHSLYTLELLLGYSLYSTQLLLGHSLYTTATAWALPVHYTGTAWVLLVHIQYNDLCTLSTLEGYCFGTPSCMLGYVFLANKLPLARPPLVHYT